MVTKTFQGLGPHGFHRVTYHEWGDPESERVVVCTHGLTRNGRDFDALAKNLSVTAVWCARICPGADKVSGSRTPWTTVTRCTWGIPRR